MTKPKITSPIVEIGGKSDLAPRFDYLAESVRTVSGEFYGEHVSASRFTDALRAFINAAAMLDRVKKLTFYGEDEKKGRLADPHYGDVRLSSLLAQLGGGKDTEFIIHGILGIASEAGELVEALTGALERDAPIDTVNLFEEIGDLQWYEAMLARVIGVDFDGIQRANIDKLRDRFPDKFTTSAANNRDLDKERATLEQGVKGE